jgi:hypothetical protein
MLLSQFPTPIDNFEFYFSPDRFDEKVRAEPCRFDGDYYVVRGPYPLEAETFMVPGPARH